MKILSVILAAVLMTFLLCACSGNGEPQETTPSTTAAETTSAEEVTTADEATVPETTTPETTAPVETTAPEVTTTAPETTEAATTTVISADPVETTGEEDEEPEEVTPQAPVIDAESFPYNTYELSQDYTPDDVELVVTEIREGGISYKIVNNSDSVVCVTNPPTIHAYINGEWVGVRFSDYIDDPMEMWEVQPDGETMLAPTSLHDIPNGLYRVGQAYQVGSFEGEVKYTSVEFVYTMAPDRADEPAADEPKTEADSYLYDTSSSSRYDDAPAVAGITLETDGYTGGDSIAYVIKNDTDDTLTLDREAAIEVFLDGGWREVYFPLDHDLPIDYPTLAARSEVAQSVNCLEMPAGRYRVIIGYRLSDLTYHSAAYEFEVK